MSAKSYHITFLPLGSHVWQLLEETPNPLSKLQGISQIGGICLKSIVSRVTINQKHISNMKYETGPSGGRAPRTRAREDQAEGLLVCLSRSSFQVPRPRPIVLLLLCPPKRKKNFSSTERLTFVAVL